MAVHPTAFMSLFKGRDKMRSLKTELFGDDKWHTAAKVIIWGKLILIHIGSRLQGILLNRFSLPEFVTIETQYQGFWEGHAWPKELLAFVNLLGNFIAESWFWKNKLEAYMWVETQMRA
jgi:hypothetical protein